MGDESTSSAIKGKKRRMVPEERALVDEYSVLQKPYHLIQQHIVPYVRKDQQLIACTSNEGRNSVKHRSKKQRQGYSPVVDCHPYNISLFDVTLDSGPLSRKKGKKDGCGENAGYYEVLKWEKELIHDHVDALKAMFEFKQIYFFIHTKKRRLNFSDVPLYIVERMFLMPRESTHLASVMTALLNHCFCLTGYSPEAPMPYQLWNSYMKMKVNEWYDIAASFGGDTLAATNYIGFEHDFFVILGPTNPLKFCDFHDLNLLQRVWLVKSLCDSLMLNDETSGEETGDKDGGDFDCPWLGTDRHGRHYFYLSYAQEQENLRVYRLYRYFFPVAGSFYGRIQRENFGQVAPCKKYHELVADDVQSLRKLASMFAEPLGTEETASQAQNSGRSARHDCESKLHQQLLDLLSEMEPLELALKSSTFKMLMLLKSDWDRYHDNDFSAGSECTLSEQHNYGNDIEARNSHGERSNYIDSPPASPVQHFLVTVLKNKSTEKLKSIVSHLRNVHKGQKFNLPNVHVTPLKKLNNESQIGVEILTPVEGRDGRSTKQIVVCDSKVCSRNDPSAEDSDSHDSVLIVEPDPTEETDLNPAIASVLLKKSSGLLPLSTRSRSPSMIIDEEMEWETASNCSSNSFEVPVESSNSGMSEKTREKNTNIHKPVHGGPEQESGCESGAPEKKELNPSASKCTAAKKHQPLVIRIGSNTDVNSKSIQLPSSDKNQEKSVDGLPSDVYKHTFANDMLSQPKTSALSVKHTSENNEKSFHGCTARKSCTPSRRQSIAGKESSLAIDNGDTTSRIMILENVSSVDSSLCTKFTVTGTGTKHVMSVNEGSVKILKAMEAQNSSHVSQVTKFPIASLISLDKIACSSDKTHSKGTSPHKSENLIISKSLLTSGNNVQCFNQLTVPYSDLTSSANGVSSVDNHCLSSVALGEDECVEVANGFLSISNQEVHVKRFPASQQLIYTLSPMETLFKTRNSLETCISATEDDLRACDSSKKSASQEYVCRNDTLSSNILADNAEKSKTQSKSDNHSLQKTLNNCETVLKNSSVSVTPVTTALVTSISSINSELSVINLTENSRDCLKFGKPEHVKRSVGVSHQSTTVVNPSEHISGSAAGIGASADSPAVANIGGTELIPVVLPDGKQILLRLVTSQPAATNTSLSNTSSNVSLLKNTIQTVGTDLSKKNNNNLHSLPSKTTSVTNTLEVSQISLTASLASNLARKDSNLSEDTCSGDIDSDTKGKGRKFGNLNSSEKVQKSTSGGETPVSSLMGKMGRKVRHAQKILEMLKSSDTHNDIMSGDLFIVGESDELIPVTKSGDLVSTAIVEKIVPAKRKLPAQPKTCESNSNSSSVSMPKVKKVEIPKMACKILSNLSSDGAVPTETLSSSPGVVSVSQCNTVSTSHVVNVNTGTVAFPGPVNQAAGNTLNILNAAGTTTGGIIILGQPQSGNSAIFAQPSVPVNQTPLLLIPSVVSTPRAQPLTAPAAYTTPLLSNPVNLGSNGILTSPAGFTSPLLRNRVNPKSDSIVSSSSAPDSRPLLLLCQNQLYMVPPVIAPVTPSSSQVKPPVTPSASQVSKNTSQSQASITVAAVVPPVITSNTLPVVIAPVTPNPSKVNNNNASQSRASSVIEAVVTPVVTSSSVVPVSASSSTVNNCTIQSPVEALVLPVTTSNQLSAVVASIPPSLSKDNKCARHSQGAVTKGSSVNRSMVCKSNKENETEDGWVVVPDPLDPLEVKKKVQKPQKVQRFNLPQNQQTVSRNFTINFFPKNKEKEKREEKKEESAVVSSSGSLYPEFPGNIEPPVVTSSKKASEKCDLNVKSRPPLTLDEPITVIPSKKQDMQ